MQWQNTIVFWPFRKPKIPRTKFRLTILVASPISSTQEPRRGPQKRPKINLALLKSPVNRIDAPKLLLTSENLQAEKSACEHRLRFDKMQTFYKSCTYSKLNYENVAYFLPCSSRKISLIYIMHDFIFVQRESPICESIFLNYYAPSFD